MLGRFNEETEAFLDFARCQRPDGSYYGTSGQCRKGNQVGAAEKAKLEKAAANGNKKAKVALDVVEGRKTKEEAKKELGYAPKSRGSNSGRNVIRNVKDAIREKLGKKRQDDITNIGFRSKDEIEQHRETMMRSAERGLKGKELEKRKKQIDEWREQKLNAFEKNKKFADDLKKEMPKGVRLTSDTSNGEVVMATKVGKNKIEATFSPSNGFNYQVNNAHARGSVTNRAEQLKIAQQVRQMYDATVRAAPEGAVFKTSAYNEDGAGAARQKAYERLGFGKPAVEGGYMFAIKRNGKMIPLKSSEGETLAKSNPIDFSEDEQDNIWLEIMYPAELQIDGEGDEE